MANIQGLRDKYANIPGERFFAELYKDEEYKPTLEVKADVVLDVGALAGEFCSYIYDKAGIIYALEPYSEHYKELEENIREFGMDKVKPFHLGLSNYTGKAKLWIQSRGGHSLSESAHSTTEEVEVTTLAQFVKDHNIDHIDILKIDIEGGEIQVFGSEDFKDVIDKISFIVGEHFTNEIHAQLEEAGFTRRNHENNVIYQRL